jgi:hypothetical protein
VTAERTDDDLGSLTIVALAVEGARYLLRSFDDAPSAATEIYCADADHPVDCARSCD